MHGFGPQPRRFARFARFATLAWALVLGVAPVTAQGEEEESEEQGVGGLSRLGDLRSSFQIFGDLGFRYNNPEATDRAESSFALGALDFFSNVQVGDNFRALSEVVIDSEADGSFSLSMERLWGMLILSDQLKVKIGTDHSPISRWNQVYHHGAFLETTVTRPFLAQFEGGSGFLPLHHTGVELSGTFLPEFGVVEYFLIVSNGRGTKPNDKQQGRDQNNNKKVDLVLAYQPECIPDLRIGAAGVFDEIPADPDSMDPERVLGIREVICAANVEYTLGDFDFLVEHVWVQHKSRVTDRTYTGSSGYAQIAHRCGSWTTFTRFDYRSLQTGDPFYRDLNRDRDAWRQIVGCRYDVSRDVSLKFEVGVGRAEFLGPGGARFTDGTVSGAFQLAWHL